ncbi:hypothetical protein ACFFRR_002956 [Megaselia abdita]
MDLASNICRICLKNIASSNYIPLRARITLEGKAQTIDEVVFLLTQVKIDENLPRNVCIECVEKLKSAVAIVNLAKRSDEILKKRLKENESTDNNIMKKPMAVLKKDGSIVYETSEGIVPFIIEPPKKDQTEKCKECQKDFANKRNLRKHLKTHGKRERSFQCGFCEKAFLSKSHLIIHSESHSNFTFSCDICGKSFYRKEGLKQHIKKHLDQTIKCDVCSKQFSTSSDLKVHMRFHNNEFPYQCDLCPEKFVIKGNYNYHLKQHNRENFKCSICSVEISLASAFRRHIFIHTGKPFPCPVETCNSSFSVKSLLTNHMKNKHDRDLSMEELKFINTNFQVKLRSLSLPLNFDIDASVL